MSARARLYEKKLRALAAAAVVAIELSSESNRARARDDAAYFERMRVVVDLACVFSGSAFFFCVRALVRIISCRRRRHRRRRRRVRLCLKMSGSIHKDGDDGGDNRGLLEKSSSIATDRAPKKAFAMLVLGAATR